MAFTRGLVEDGKYYYMQDLLNLDAQQPRSDVSHLIISPEVYIPLSVSAWTEELSSHPDKLFAKFMLQGLQRIEFDRRIWLQPASYNLSVHNPQTVTE